MLSADEVLDRLQLLSVEWSLIGGNRLERIYTLGDFDAALAFVNAISVPIKQQNHHPDIQLSNVGVKVSTTTHEANGLTEKDFSLAQAIEEIAKSD